jgi:hypothetical protein
MHRLKMLLLTVFLGTSCAHAGLFSDREGEKVDCMAKHSKAWCALDAAMMADGLKDAPADQVQQVVRNRTGDALWYAGAVGGLASGFFRPTPGLPIQAEIAAMALGLFGATIGPSSMGWNGIFGWMPAEMAKDRREATEVVATIVHEAHERVFGESRLRMESERSGQDLDAYTLKGRSRVVFDLAGEGCAESVCKLTVVRPYGDIVKKQQPKWMGTSEVWGVSIGATSAGAFLPWRLEVKGVDRSSTYLQALSKELPAWLYVWVSPETTRDGKLLNSGQAMPVVYNQGKAMLMAYPEVQAPAPTTETANALPVQN